ncbi:S8 family serine peptidase [Paenibacillus sp. B01]|uniref:S8 family serine peptidase n=1 Tax=Paenibacillus sp. B01 TaxID=2660554 RepID=UPI001890D1BB|nr:S8 family serine peptidase [Paenibacillus sp. B01]
MIKIKYKKWISSLLFFLLICTMINPAIIASNISNNENISSELVVTDSTYNLDSSVTENIYNTRSYFVKLKNSKQDKLEFVNKKKLKKFKHKILKYADSIEIELTEQVAAQMSADPEVLLVEENSIASILSIDKPNKNNSEVRKIKNNTEIIPWGLKAIGADMAKNKGNSVKVAVLDTGISNHPDLKVEGGISFVENASSSIDDNGHGTHVAGTIAAKDNKQGVVGVSPKVDLYSVKVLDASGAGTYSSIIQGIEWAIDNKMDIISMSFGGAEPNVSLHEAIIQASKKNIILVGAAGNLGYGSENEVYPARYDEVISVAAVNKNFKRASYSSTGSGVDIAAPGAEILSTSNQADYATLSGTSMAVPHVTGAVASLWSQNKKWTSQQIVNRLYMTATPMGQKSEYGYGILNLARALGVIDHPIPPFEEESSFNINAWDTRVLVQLNRLIDLQSFAKEAGFKELASQMEEKINYLNELNKSLHELPIEFSQIYSKEEVIQRSYDENEYFKLNSQAFQELENEYKTAVSTYQTILERPAVGLNGIKASDLSVQESKTVTVQFPETLDNSYNRSQTISIPNLTSIDGITVSNGSVSYAVSGSNVTVTVGGGSPTRTAYNGYKFQQLKSLTVYRDRLGELPPTWSIDENGYKGDIPKTGEPYAYTGSYTSSDTKTVNTVEWGTVNTEFPPYKSYDQDGYKGPLYKTGDKYQLSQTQYGSRDSSSSSGFASYIMYDDGSYKGALYTTGSSYVVSGAYTPSSSQSFTGSCSNNVVNTYRYGVLQNSSSGSCPSSYSINSNGYVGSIPQSGSAQLTYNSGSCPSTAASCTQTKTYVQNYAGTLSKPAVDTRTWRQDYRGTVYSYNYYQNYRGDVTRPEVDTRKWLQTYEGHIYKGGTDTFYSYTVNINATVTPPDVTPPSTPGNLFARNVTSSTVTLQWDASTDDSGVPGYNVYKNGVFERTSTAAVAQVSNLSASTSYQFSVRAIDRSGNLSAYSNTITVTTAGPSYDNSPILSSGSSVDVDLPSGSFNVYRIIPSTSGTYSFTTGPFGGTGSSNDTYLELYSDSQLTNRIAFNDDYNSTMFSHISTMLTSGTIYYLKLKGYESTAVHARLSVTQTQVLQHQTMLLDQPIDVESPAGTFKTYQFTPAVTGSYRIFTNYFMGANSSGTNDTYLSLYSDSAMSNHVISNDDSNGTVFSTLTTTLEAGKTYYIKLRHYNTTTSIKARLMATVGLPSFTILDLGSNSSKSISTPVGTPAYFSFTAPDSSLYRFYTSSYQGVGSSSNTALRLYRDQALTSELAYNNDLVNNPYGDQFSSIEFSLTGGTTYYIKVESADNTGIYANITVEKDSDGTRAGATPASWEQIYTNELSSKLDKDYFRVDVSEPMEVHLNITANKVTLYDSVGDIYGLFLPNDLESFTLPTSGVYYALVEYYSDIETAALSAQSNPVVNLSVALSVYSDGISIANVRAQAISTYYVSNKQTGVMFGSDGASSMGTTGYLDGTNTVNYANIKYSYWSSHNNTTIQVLNQFGNLVYEETVGYRAGQTMSPGGYAIPSTYYFKWKGELNRNTSLAVPYDTDWDGYPDKNLAPNGIYYVVIKPTDAPGNSHPTIASLSVINDSNYLTKTILPPPKTMKNGVVITSSNKGKCEVCLKYFIKYVWDRGGSFPTPQLTQYDAWLRGIYGLNGLEKFWAYTESFVYNPNQSVMDNLQRLISYGGFIPVLGAGPDGINSVLYLIRGQEANAALSAVGMVPFYGDSILGVRVFKQIYRFNPCNCFAAGTEVDTETGLRPIETIQVGDRVWSKNPDTGEVAFKRVEAIYTRQTNETWTVYFGNESLKTTDLHPFWIKGKGWVYARDLKPGDELESRTGAFLTVKKIVQASEKITLYNFSVEDFHTYYVSSIGILTHNSTCIPASIYEARVAGKIKSTMTGSTPSEILRKELQSANLIPDAAEGSISSWQAHHIVPAGASNVKDAKDARDTLVNDFKIDINSAANGIWLPKVKGETFYAMQDWDGVTVQLATHNGGHTTSYYSYVNKKLSDTYLKYGPSGMNLPLADLQREAQLTLQSIRKDLIEGKIAIGKVK